MRTLLLLAAATALVQDKSTTQAGGRVDWGKNVAAAERRAKLEQRAILVYFTDGGAPSKALDAGAFSSDDVIKALRGMHPVLLECPDETAHADLRKRWGVSAFPTLMVVEPDGKTTQEILARAPAEVAAELAKVTRKFPGRDVLWLSSIDAAVQKSKDEPRPLAIYFHAADEDLSDSQDRLVKLAGQGRIDKFIWVELSATNDDKDALKVKYEYMSLPAIAFVDPRFPEPRQIGIFELKEKTKSKDVQDQLEKRLKKYKDTKIKKRD
jgi:hypothetical protein